MAPDCTPVGCRCKSCRIRTEIMWKTIGFPSDACAIACGLSDGLSNGIPTKSSLPLLPNTFPPPPPPRTLVLLTEHLHHRCWSCSIPSNARAQKPGSRLWAEIQSKQNKTKRTEPPDSWLRNSGIRVGGQHQPATCAGQDQATRPR